MKIFALPLFFFFTLTGLADESQRKIAFKRGNSVWVANLDGTVETKIAQGSCPDIAPDGRRLAFNTDKEFTIPNPPKRHIAVADLATNNVTIFEKIPSDNCCRPVWSPDGSKLVFLIWAEERWRLGIINADGSGFYLLKDASVKADPLYKFGTFWEPAWARDGMSIFCHDMSNIYCIDAHGNILKKWALSEL